jgi:monodehydroascorbate reductase (NADH)
VFGFLSFHLQAVRLTDFKAPGADLAGIQYLRNVADADALLAAVAAAKAAGNKVGRGQSW